MKFCKIIIRNTKTDTAKLQSFAVDPLAAFIFFTKHDPKSRAGAAILRYSTDGSHMQSLLQEKIFFPYYLTLDIAMKRIYFLDHYFDFIQQCDYSGGNRQFLQKLPLMKFHRVAIFENRFFAAIHNNNSVVQIREGFTSFKRAATEDLSSQPKQFKIFHQQVQPINSRTKVCSGMNKCEHLCVPVLETTNSSVPKIREKCLCGEGYKLENGKCSIPGSQKFLMYVQDSPQTLKGVDLNSSDEHIAPIVGLKPNVAFDVDLNKRIVYFTSYLSMNDSEASIIEFRSLDGFSRGMLKGIFGAIQSMVFDWVGKNLFISSQSPRPKISAIRLCNGSGSDLIIRTVISKNITGPISLALDPEEGECDNFINVLLAFFCMKITTFWFS